MELVATKTKEHMPQLDRRGQRRGLKKNRLNARDSTLSKRTREEKVLRGFKMEITKTSLGNVVPKGAKPLSRIQHTMSNFSI